MGWACCPGSPRGLWGAGLIITLEAFFLFVARQLGDTARDMVKFKAQKDDLIDELKLERDKAEAEKSRPSKPTRPNPYSSPP